MEKESKMGVRKENSKMKEIEKIVRKRMKELIKNKLGLDIEKGNSYSENTENLIIKDINKILWRQR
ncbi:MAG: hypothetical protein AABY22_28700 [Nanoarchaeota archaeon]